jgi:ligand-binding sensor protein
MFLIIRLISGEGLISVTLELRAIIEPGVLQEIQDKFSEATDIAAIIADSAGYGITKPSKFSDFCLMIRSSGKGLKRCFRSDEIVGRSAADTGKTCIHNCHAGLIDLAAPIIVDNIHFGSVLCGQVVLHPPGPQEFNNVKKLADELDLDAKVLIKSFAKIQVVHEHRVKASADLLQIISNYIVGMGVNKLTQQKLLNELKTRASIEDTLRLLELKTLQSQVNPHFLFNTLNMVAKQALLEKAQKTAEIVYSFSKLLRYNLGKIDKVVTLAEEINSIQDYLFIQKKVSGEILQVKIPFMTLQPIVENAIIHGLEPKIDGGDVLIRGELSGSDVVIEISDNGLGIEADRLREIMKRSSLSGKGHTTGIGIANVNERLKHYYGADHGLEIISQWGKGTTVRISIPRITEEADGERENRELLILKS